LGGPFPFAARCYACSRFAFPNDIAKQGVRRLSAGSAIAQAAFRLSGRLATDFLAGSWNDMFAVAADYGAMNQLFRSDDPHLQSSWFAFPGVRSSTSWLLEASWAPLLNVVNLDQCHANAAIFAGDYRGISSGRKSRYDSRFQVITGRDRHRYEFVGLGCHVFPVVVVLDERTIPVV
jgi:hypothetical protein